MKMFNLYFMIISIFILGCNKNDNPVNPDENNIGVIMPLTVGNQWTYIDSTFDENGFLTSVDSSKLGITGKTNIIYNGQSLEVFYWNWIDPDNNQPDDGKWLCRNETEGLYFYGGRFLDSNFVLGKTLSRKYPVNIGDTWEEINYTYSTVDSSFRIADTSLITCISVNEKFNTIIGEFECYVYNYQRTFGNENDDIYLYFAKDVGFVGYQSIRKDILMRNKNLYSRIIYQL